MGVKFFSALVIFLILFSVLTYAKDETKVIIKFKDPSSLKKMHMLDEKDRLDIKKTEIANYRKNILKRFDLEIEHEYNYTNTIIAYVNETQLKELKKSKYVEGIYEDMPISAFLDTSKTIVGADTFWNTDILGFPVNGSEETVCIIDTGIDYTHAAFGSCSIINETQSGNIVSYDYESIHPYTNDMDQLVKINYTGFEKISVHFINLSMESEWDYVKILDTNNNTVALYTGFMEDVWSPSISGDTLYIRLQTDDSVTGWGYKVDKIINGTVNTSLNWSRCEKVIGGWDLTGRQNRLDDQDPRDDEGHGSHVSGIISSNDVTYKGIASGSRIVSVKALDDTGSGNTTDVMAAMEFCIENKDRYNISVISLSLGSGSYSTSCDQNSGLFSLFSSLVKDAINNGIMVVAASGNSGYSTGIAFPACLENVTSVGAVNKADVIDISYSNSNSLLDLLAPGTLIYSVQMGGGFVQSTGTSMAAPHVSAAALLIRNFKRRENGTILTPLQIKSILKASGNNRTDSRNSFKTERINLTSALQLIDDMPKIQFLESLIGNTTKNFTFINITATEPISSVIEFDNTSFLMQGSNKDFFFRINLTAKHNYTISLNDSTGNVVNYGPYFVSHDETLPRAFGIRNISSTDSAFTFSFNTSEDTNFTVFYGNSSGIYPYNYTSSSFARYHLIGLTSLNPNTTYYYFIGINDNAGNYNSSEEYTLRTNESDLFPPIINITYPYNNSIINQSYKINLSISINEDSTCIFYLDQSYNITQNANFSIYENGQKNLTVNCTDLSNNTASKRIFFQINDTISPIKSSFIVSSTKSSITFTFNTDEPSNATVFDQVSGYKLSHSMTKSGLSSGTNYQYELMICDRLKNCNTTVGSKTTLASGGGGGSGGSSGGSGGYTRTIIEVKPDFSDTGFVNTDYKGKIVFKKTALPAEIIKPAGNIYQLLEITANESKQTELVFKVNRSWIRYNEIIDVLLARYDLKWQELPTILSYSDDSFNYYNSTTPGFSYFAIIGKKEDTKKNETFQLNAFEEQSSNNDLDVPNDIIRPKPNFSIFLAFLTVLILASILVIYFKSNKK